MDRYSDTFASMDSIRTIKAGASIQLNSTTQEAIKDKIRVMLNVTYSNGINLMIDKILVEENGCQMLIDDYVQHCIKDATEPLLKEIEELKYKLKSVTATFNSDVLEPPYKKIRCD